MQKFPCFVFLILFFSCLGFSDPVFMAMCDQGLKGNRTTYQNSDFETEDDAMTSKFVFRIDSSDTKTLIVDQARSGLPLNSTKYFIVGLTEDYIQAVGSWDGTTQIYTIQKKENIVYWTNQRVAFIDGLGSQWPSIVSAMWGRLKIAYDYTE